MSVGQQEDTGADAETDLELQGTLPSKRIQRKKTMPGEMAEHETFTEAESVYRIEVHTLIMDAVIENLHQQFLSNDTLC